MKIPLPDSQFSASAADDGDLAELLERIASRLKAGENVTLEEFVALWPEQEREIRELYPAIAAMVGMGVDSPSSSDVPPFSLLEASSILARPSRHRLGDFQILREVGRGGMGVVYEAEQISLGRRVALKVLPFAAMLDERLLKRFKNEARAAATLEHPHIVSVHFIGCERGIHFFAMQFVDGQTLEELIRRLKSDSPSDSTPARSAAETASLLGPSQKPPPSVPAEEEQEEGQDMVVEELPAEADESSSFGYWLPGDAWKSSRRNAADSEAVNTRARSEDPTTSLASGGSLYHRIAQLAVQAADAVEHAHQQRIIHRDLKPSNLMLDEHGHIWVTDFGLATTLADNNLTLTGDLIGTLRYSSPEQAGGGGVVDHRTDIYSLGITLYELLALRPGFDAEDRHQLLEQILHKEPPRLRKVRPDIPVDLEVIVHKAISKDPQERYQTARDFADDLRRFLSHQPIKARPPAAWEAAIKWVRRRPGVALVMLGASLAAVAVAIALSLYTVQLRGAYARLEEMDQEGRRHQSQIHRGIVYPASISAAAAAIEQRDFEAARRALDACRPTTPGVDDPCGFEWDLLDNRTRAPNLVWTFQETGAPIMSVAVSPSGEFAATGDKTGTVSLWSLRSGQKLKSWHPFAGETQVIFSPRGTWLAAGSDYRDGRVVLWNVAELKEAASLVAHDGTTYALAFSPDEKTLATGGREETIKLWTVADLTAAHGIPDSPRPSPLWTVTAASVIYDLQFSPDGVWLISAEKQGRLRLWSAADGAPRSTICETTDAPSFQACCLLDQGRIGMAGGYGNMLRFVDLASRMDIAAFDCRDTIYDIAVSQDEKTIAAACGDGSMILLRVDGPQLKQVQQICFGAHQGRVRKVAFSQDNRWLLTASDDGTAKVWKLDSLPAPEVSLVNLRTGDGLRQVLYDPAGKWLAVLGSDRVVRILNAQNHSLVKKLSIRGKGFDRVVCDSRGEHLVTTSGNEAFVWESKDWKRTRSLTIPGNHILCSFNKQNDALITLNSPDGETCALRVWELSSGKNLRTINLGPDLPSSVARAPDGSSLAVAVEAGRLVLIDLETFQQRNVPLPFSRVSHLAFSPWAKQLSAAGEEYRFCLVDVPGAKVVSYQRIAASKISGTAFTADRRLLAIADQEQKCIHFWDQESSRVLFTLDTLHFSPQEVVLSPDGRTLSAPTAEANAQGVSGILEWDLAPPRREATAPPATTARE